MKYVSAVIFVKDIHRSKFFYHTLLELEMEYDFGSNITFENGMSIWQINKDHIIEDLLNTGMEDEQPVNRFELYFETDNILETDNKLRLSNTKYFHKIRKEPWGQLTLRVFDPDNHLVDLYHNLHP